MGSLARSSALERFGDEFGERIQRHFEKELLGLFVLNMSELTVDYHKKADITLSNGTTQEVHFGWASEREEYYQKEFLDKGEITKEEYFEVFMKDEKITEVSTGFDRDDEYYVFASLGEGNISLEIPIGYDPENNLYHGDESLISEVEFEVFRERN